MCGRFSLTVPQRLRTAFPQYRFPLVAPRYNVAPTQPVLAVTNMRSDEAETMTWGMAGHVNARAESVAVKPSFRNAVRERRAVVFADGYYEWKAHGDGKQPYFIRRPDGEPFTFAAIWDEQLERAVTLLTAEASPALQSIHHRMPVILGPAAREEWLRAGPLDEDAIARVVRDREVELESYPVSLAVNRVANDAPILIERVSPPEQPSLF